MRKTYSPDGLLISETSRDPIDLMLWLKTICANRRTQRPHPLSLLEKTGSYFGNRLSEYPKNITLPRRVERGYCHTNNLLYAQILLDTHMDILSDFRFVTGLWQRKAKTIRPWHDANYCIGPHSFLTYQGNVLDIGALANPSDFYEVTQYFGMSFEVPYVLDAYAALQNAGIDTDTIPIIEVLLTPPCSL